MPLPPKSRSPNPKNLPSPRRTCPTPPDTVAAAVRANPGVPCGTRRRSPPPAREPAAGPRGPSAAARLPRVRRRLRLAPCRRRPPPPSPDLAATGDRASHPPPPVPPSSVARRHVTPPPRPRPPRPVRRPSPAALAGAAAPEPRAPPAPVSRRRLPRPVSPPSAVPSTSAPRSGEIRPDPPSPASPAPANLVSRTSTFSLTPENIPKSPVFINMCACSTVCNFVHIASFRTCNMYELFVS